MSTLNLNSLKDSGAFTGAPVKKSITWKNEKGEEIRNDVWVRRMSYAAAVGDAIVMTGGGADPVAARIAASICDEEGKPVFTAADITGEADPERGPLCHSLTMALLTVAAEVNSPKLES